MSKASAASPEKSYAYDRQDLPASFGVCAVPFVRSAYNYDRNAASDESGLSCQDGTRTKQEFAEEADINTIVKRFGITGQLPTNVPAVTYGDFEEIVDMHGALEVVRAASESFAAMPADVRQRFVNDPARFVDFCSDPSNRDEAIRLGLVNLPPAPPAAAPPGDSGKPEGDSKA